MERWEQINNTFLTAIALSGLTGCRNYTVPCTLINATGKVILPSCCHTDQSQGKNKPKNLRKMELTSQRLALPLGTGWSWIYDNKAWKILPRHKDQACTLEAVIPNITTFDHTENSNGRNKRSVNPLVTHPTLFHSRVRTLLPSFGVLTHSNCKHLSRYWSY